MFVHVALLCFFVTICSGAAMTRDPRENVVQQSNDLYPIILVPGDGGSQIEAFIDHWSLCSLCTHKKGEWFNVWLNLYFLVPGCISCFVDIMKLTYHPDSHTTTDQQGIKTRIPGFGNTSTVEHMDPDDYHFSKYYVGLVDYLVFNLNYTRDINIHGAPYDFRKSPNELGEYFEALAKLTERTYAVNKQRVVLVGHSMGNLLLLYFLNHQSQKWKDTHIQSFISIAGPYGGAVKSMRLFASGYNLDIDYFGPKPISIREEQRSMTSSAFLLPYDTFWKSDEVIVYAPTGNYTVKDYAKFFDHIAFPNGYLMRSDTENLIKKLEAPGVEVHCLYGTDMPTEEAYVYANVKTGKNWYDYGPASIRYGNGDGTVANRSLLGCQPWSGQQKAPVYLQDFSGAEHLKIINDPRLIMYIAKAVAPKRLRL